MHGGFHVEDGVLHIGHETHDLGVAGLGQCQRVHFSVIGEITVVLQQVEGKPFLCERAGAEFTQERLVVAVLPNHIGSGAQSAGERRQVVETDPSGGIEAAIECEIVCTGIGCHACHGVASLRWY